MDYFSYVKVNIYNPNKLMIPTMGRRDETLKGVTIRYRFIEKIRRAGIEVYTVEEDQERLTKLNSQTQKVETEINTELKVEAFQEPVEPVVEETVVEPAPEVEPVADEMVEVVGEELVELSPELEPAVEEVQAEIKSEIPESIEEVKAVEPVITAQDLIETIVPSTELDEAIEKKLEELPEEPEIGENIVLNEEDFQEMADRSGMKKYERITLEGMTKAQLKHILNVERAFPPGHEYYGSHHDGHVALVEHVLNSQK